MRRRLCKIIFCRIAKYSSHIICHRFTKWTTIVQRCRYPWLSGRCICDNCEKLEEIYDCWNMSLREENGMSRFKERPQFDFAFGGCFITLSLRFINRHVFICFIRVHPFVCYHVCTYSPTIIIRNCSGSNCRDSCRDTTLKLIKLSFRRPRSHRVARFASVRPFHVFAPIDALSRVIPLLPDIWHGSSEVLCEDVVEIVPHGRDFRDVSQWETISDYSESFSRLPPTGGSFDSG
jgi:hypothetical protein